ncbi:unnamed protein product [Phytophthora fragariaefolia]|uniref:Unnamed protein product n=1 Tax=Phytophthora fragariaefolia TaxID=1490495 RepID=A0A9W6XYV9_9STRA|nr:unnamed protein product [Phytophthora fragariaefolia]
MMGSRNANSPLAPPEINETAVATTSHNRHEEYVVTAAEVPNSGDATTNIVFPMASPSTILLLSHVTTSIREYVPPAGFTILPKRRGERSIILDWGVRLSSWSSKTQKGTKYIGVRFYFIDKNWKFQSILLGTRHDKPMYGERSDGSRGSLKRWIMELLKDFGLSAKDLFASTSDAGPHVKWMTRRDLALKWEWCVPHVTNAATKSAFGIVPQRQNPKNPEATDLIFRIARTTYTIRSNSSMGSLFRELCEMANNGNNSKSTELVEHKDHRFMGLAKVIRHLLEKWEQLEDWFQGRINKATRERKPAPESLPIADDKATLLQLYDLLGPIAALNTKSEKEDANQCEVLLSMFRLRTTVLDETQPIKDKMREASKPPLYYQVRDLTRLTKNTRALLPKQFHKNFFIRNTDRGRVRNPSYIPEMHMLLHPFLKNEDNNLAKIVRLCNEQLRCKSAVVDRLRDILLDILRSNFQAPPPASTIPQSSISPIEALADMLAPPRLPPTLFSDDLMEFAEEEPDQASERNVHESRVNEEADRWLADPSRFQVINGKTETILEFWKRQYDESNYRLLSLAARVVHAVPASATQIERDFDISGMLVTSHRTSLAKHKVKDAIPANVMVALAAEHIDTPFSAEWEREMASCLLDAECID